MIKIKVYDKTTDKQVAEKTLKNMREYREYLCKQVDHKKQYAFGVRV